MADERLRIIVDDPYLLALGRTLFVFSGLGPVLIKLAERGEA